MDYQMFPLPCSTTASILWRRIDVGYTIYLYTNKDIFNYEVQPIRVHCYFFMYICTETLGDHTISELLTRVKSENQH